MLIEFPKNFGCINHSNIIQVYKHRDENSDLPVIKIEYFMSENVIKAWTFNYTNEEKRDQDLKSLTNRINEAYLSRDNINWKHIFENLI